jgi:hypothetical protein
MPQSVARIEQDATKRLDCPESNVVAPYTKEEDLLRYLSTSSVVVRDNHGFQSLRFVEAMVDDSGES